MWDAKMGFFLLSLLVRSTIADDDNEFTNPTTPGKSGSFASNPVWKPGSVQRVSWTTTLEAYDIALFHQKSKSGSGSQVRIIHTLESNGSGDQSFDWTVDTYGTSTTSSSAFYFSVDSGDSDGFTSHYFNISNEASSTTRSTTSSSPSPTSSSTAAPHRITATSSTHHATKTVAAATKGSSNSKSKGGSKGKSKGKSKGSATNATPRSVGLGIGAGLGAFVVTIGGLIGFFTVKQSKFVQRIIEHRQQSKRAKEEPAPVWCPDDQA